MQDRSDAVLHLFFIFVTKKTQAMKRILVTSLFLCSMLFAAAQGVIVGGRVGVTQASLAAVKSGDPLTEGFSGKMGWGAGGFVELPISKTFSLQVGLQYDLFTAERTGYQALPGAQAKRLSGMNQRVAAIIKDNPAGLILLSQAMQTMPDPLWVDVNNRLEFNYLTLPVMAKFGWDLGAGSPLRLSVGAGVYASYLMVVGQITKGSSKVYAGYDRQSFSNFWANDYHPNLNQATAQGMADIYEVVDGLDATDLSDSYSVTKDYNALDFGLAANVGLSYRFDRNAVFIEAGYRYGLTSLQKNSGTMGESRLSALSVMAGYSFQLKRKQP